MLMLLFSVPVSLVKTTIIVISLHQSDQTVTLLSHAFRAIRVLVQVMGSVGTIMKSLMHLRSFLVSSLLGNFKFGFLV
eukprot:10416449-Heterocapsa_arctica.AAC.1